MVLSQAHNWIQGLCLLSMRDLLLRLMPANSACLASRLYTPPPITIVNHHIHFSKSVRWLHVPNGSRHKRLQIRIGRRLSLSHKLILIKSWCQAFNIKKALVMSEQGGYLDAKKNIMAMTELEANEEIKWLAKELPELIVPIATGHPGYGDPMAVEPFLQSGFKGLKLHPHQLQRHADCQHYHPYMELAEQYKIPVQVHTGLSDFAAPQRVLQLSRCYPQVPVIMIHTDINPDGTASTGQLLQTLTQVAAAADHGQDIYVDLSCHSSKHYPIDEALQLLGEDRIIFGSDGNIDDPRSFIQSSKNLISLYESIYRYGGNSATKKICRQNTERLYILS